MSFQKIQAFLGILFVAVMFNGKGSQSIKRGLHLGCNFQDDKYTLKADKHVFGTPMEPEEFTRETFGKFLANALHIYKAVLASYQLTDMDVLVKFVQDYKAQSGTKKDLETFYNEYQFPTDLVKDSASMVLSFFKRLTEVHPEVEDNLYLVKVILDMQPPDNETVNTFKVTAPEYPKKFFHGHVAGGLLYKIGDDVGRLIFDLELGVELPIFIGKDPGYITLEGGISPRISFRGADDSFIVGLAYEHADPTVTNNIMQKFLYYTGKPYCSFISTYSKPNLLAPDHSIFTQYNNGAPQCDFEFRVVPVKDFKRIPYRLNMFSQKYQVMRNEQEFRNFDENLTPAEKAVIDLVGPLLFMTPEQLKDKIKEIKQVIFSEEKLVNELYTLKEKQYNQEVELSKKCEPDVTDAKKIETCLQTNEGTKKILKKFEELSGRPVWNDPGFDDETMAMAVAEKQMERFKGKERDPRDDDGILYD